MSKIWTGQINNNNNSGQECNNSNPNGSTPSSGNIVRNLLVHIAGNRATWEHMGIHGALWQVFFLSPPPFFNYNIINNTHTHTHIHIHKKTQINPERAGTIFGCEDISSESNVTDKLERAMVRSVRVIESNTNIDEVVAVQIDGLPPREFTKNGEGAAFFLTGEGRVTQQQEIYSMSGNTELGLAWMKQFPRYTNHNLETTGVMFLTGASYYFVFYDHPVLHMMHANEDQFGVQILQETSMEGGCWYKVDVDTFVYCIRMLRETVLLYTPPTFNLSTLTVRIKKPDGQRWLHICPHLVSSLISDEVRESNEPDIIAEAKRLGVQRYFDRPLFVTLRLAVELSLPETPAVAAATANSNGNGGVGGGIAASIAQACGIASTSASMMMQQQQQQVGVGGSGSSATASNNLNGNGNNSSSNNNNNMGKLSSGGLQSSQK